MPRFEDQPRPYIMPPCHEKVTIVHEDEHLLVINKPSGLLSQPGRHSLNKDCAVTRMQETHPTARIVHRLDADTSGLLMLPLGRDNEVSISKQFQAKGVYKEYIAEVFGLVDQNEGEIDLPIARDWERRPLQKICAETGKPSQTLYRVISRDEEKQTTRLLLIPQTGRTHQLRIHMQQFGHPILGCDMYAHQEAYDMSPRLLLHAAKLALKHPHTAEAVTFDCPPAF